MPAPESATALSKASIYGNIPSMHYFSSVIRTTTGIQAPSGSRIEHCAFFETAALRPPQDEVSF
jgi:hypothetical protein